MRLLENALKPLTDAETRLARFEVEPKAVRVALPSLRSFLSLRNPRAYEIITMPQGDWAEIQRRGAGDYEAHNKWLAFALKQLFVRPSSSTEAFESLVVNTVSPEQQLDGRWLFERMQKPIIALTGNRKKGLKLLLGVGGERA